MRIFVVLFLAIALLGAALIAARLLFPLPDISGRQAETAIPVSGATKLGRIAMQAAADHPGQSGVLPLEEGQDALAARLALAAAAETSIDAQYYIWHDDVSGRLLLKALYDAAARGVRVRLLLDDNGIPGLDATLAALAHQPNFAIRLFNPSTIRSPKLAGYSFDFFRMNRRMHNKSFTVDGAAAVIGGRNIGDEYFRVGDDNYFIDLDVLAFGAAAADTQKMFDTYWNSGSVYALGQMVAGTGDLQAFLANAENARNAPAGQSVRQNLGKIAQLLQTQPPDIEWAKVQLVADDPAKGLGLARRDQLMITRLGAILEGVGQKADLVSAYFVPGQQGTEWFASLARSGRSLRVLTNSMNVTDVILVHAGYAKRRKALLQAGLQLFELKPGDAPPDDGGNALLGLSGASLHAKTFAIDGARLFIGSFNFDPRSALLNCEMGYLIESPRLARQVSTAFDEIVGKVAYSLSLAPGGDIQWRERLPDGSTRDYDTEPGTSRLSRAAIAVLGALPIDWLL